MRTPRPSTIPAPAPPRRILRLASAALSGLAAALLVACGSTGKGLIPAGSAGPLQSDFESVAQAAQSGEGNCSATEAALTKTDQDFAALPASLDAGLRNTLRQGIDNLHLKARALCAQPLAGTSTTATTTGATSTTTTPTKTETTPTTTTSTTPTTTAPAEPGPGGGTPAPGAEPEASQGGGTGAGGDSQGRSGGAGAGEEGK